MMIDPYGLYFIVLQWNSIMVNDNTPSEWTREPINKNCLDLAFSVTQFLTGVFG